MIPPLFRFYEVKYKIKSEQPADVQRTPLPSMRVF